MTVQLQIASFSNLENTIQKNAQSRNDNTISNYENRIYTEFAEYKDFSRTNFCLKKAILSIVAYIINNTENVTDLSNSLREEAEERNKNVVQKIFAEGSRSRDYPSNKPRIF
jgi:translation initiation factor 2B subunit (eIF-2B alpha/beta/delta family)